MTATVEKEQYWLHRDERVDSITVHLEGKLRFYSYTYRILGPHGHWRSAIRWDNLGQTPHVDKFDEKGNFQEQIPAAPKSQREVVKLVTIFRRNLLFMDISKL